MENLKLTKNNFGNEGCELVSPPTGEPEGAL